MKLSDRIIQSIWDSDEAGETLEEVIEALKTDLLNLCEDNEPMQIAILQYFDGEEEEEEDE